MAELELKVIDTIKASEEDLRLEREIETERVIDKFVSQDLKYACDEYKRIPVISAQYIKKGSILESCVAGEVVINSEVICSEYFDEKEFSRMNSFNLFIKLEPLGRLRYNAYGLINGFTEPKTDAEIEFLSVYKRVKKTKPINLRLNTAISEELLKDRDRIESWLKEKQKFRIYLVEIDTIDTLRDRVYSLVAMDPREEKLSIEKYGDVFVFRGPKSYGYSQEDSGMVRELENFRLSYFCNSLSYYKLNIGYKSNVLMKYQKIGEASLSRVQFDMSMAYLALDNDYGTKNCDICPITIKDHFWKQLNGTPLSK